MSHFSYNLNKLTQEERQRRYQLVLRFAQTNVYFAYLPYVSNPTNNYLKYTNQFLNSLILEMNYGNLEADYHSADFKRLYQQFVRDYQFNIQAYAREEQERLRIQQQQQQLATQNYNSINTQPVAYDPRYQYQQQQQFYQKQYQQQYQQQYNPQQYPQQYTPQYSQQHGQYQQQYHQQGYRQNQGPRERKPYRDQTGQSHQGRQHNQNREHHYQNNQHQQNNRGKYYNQKKTQQNYQPQSFEKPYHDPNHEDHHLWKKYHTKTGNDAIGFQNYEEYVTFVKFKQTYGLNIQVKYDPLAQFASQTKLLDQDQPDTKQLVNQAATKVQIVPEPVVIPLPQPKPQPKPRKFTIEQIKQFINSVTKQELQKHANPQVIAKAVQVSGWKTQEIEVEQKQDKLSRKQSKRPNDKNQAIKTGGRKDEAKVAESFGYKAKQAPLVQITIGKNETLQTRKIKQDIKNMAGKDFATLKQQQYKNMDQAQKSRKQIIYNLNLIVPQNMKQIQKDLIVFLVNDLNVCKVLIEQIIKKAWDQPKYASTYAKLCSDFTKTSQEFKFQGKKNQGKKQKQQSKKKDNPFKYLLIQRVQHSFDQKIQKFPQFQSTQDKQIFLKQKKKQILSNVKFIAQLIVHKILKKKTIKYCISQLFSSFLSHYYNFKHDNLIQDSVYDFHFEAIIEFIENIGQVYDQIDEKQKKINYDYKIIQNHISSIIKLKQKPDNKILQYIQYFNGDQNFRLLQCIDLSFIRENFPRLSALLKNLFERRAHKWKKHLSVAQGPKKLKQIQEDILKEQDDHQGKGKDKISNQKMQQQKLDKKVKQLFQGWQMDKKQQLRQIQQILKKTSKKTFYFSFLKQVADQKKDNVIKRVKLFSVLLKQRFDYNQFKNAWFDIINYLAIGSSDYPYCAAALARVIQDLIQSQGPQGNIQDFYKQYNEDEQQDELFFLQDILQKYFHYSQDEKVKKWVKPKAKLSNLI